MMPEDCLIKKNIADKTLKRICFQVEKVMIYPGKDITHYFLVKEKIREIYNTLRENI